MSRMFNNSLLQRIDGRAADHLSILMVSREFQRASVDLRHDNVDVCGVNGPNDSGNEKLSKHAKVYM